MRSPRTCAAAVAAAALLLTGCSSGSGGGSASDGDGYAASGTVRITVAMAAGGGSDRATRVMSTAINEIADGYSTVVENREGGGGAVGWSYFSALTGQPNQLVKSETAMHTLPRQEGVDLPWTYADFTPIAMFAEDSRMVVVPADSPHETCTDLVDASGLQAGVSGTFGADGMVLSELEDAGLDAQQVPFGSTGEVVTALLSGQIDFAPVSAAAVTQYIESGDFRGVCTFSEERFDDEVLGDVETAIEQGIDATVVIWRGLLGPPEMPEDAAAFWEDQIRQAVETDAYAEYIATDLLLPTQLYGDEFGAYLDEYDAQIEGYFP